MEADDCYTPTYPLNLGSSKYVDIAQYVAKTVNEAHLPPGINYTTLLRITCVQIYVQLGFDYRVQITLAQTNCSNPSNDNVCVSQSYIPTLLVEAMVYVQPWFGSETVASVKIKVQDCSGPLITAATPATDCSIYLPPTTVHELQNVSQCFKRLGSGENLGQSNCSSVLNVTLRQSLLQSEHISFVGRGPTVACLMIGHRVHAIWLI